MTLLSAASAILTSTREAHSSSAPTLPNFPRWNKLLSCRKLAKVVGQYTQAAFKEDGKGTVLHFATALGWKEEEVTVFMAQHHREIRSPKIHAYYKQKVIWGRKPEAS